MALARHVKKAARLIASLQKQGISEGDKCPCCGQSTMSGTDEDNFFVKDLGIYICNACGFEIELSSIIGEGLPYEDWAMFSQESVDSLPTGQTSHQDAAAKFREGDRVVDIHSDWPGTVTHVLPQGNLYEVRLDGKSHDTHILKDREMVFEMPFDREAYANIVKGRINISDKIRIEKIASQVGNPHAGETGKVVEILANGGITVQLDGDSNQTVIYPDVDRFQVIGVKTADDDFED